MGFVKLFTEKLHFILYTSGFDLARGNIRQFLSVNFMQIFQLFYIRKSVKIKKHNTPDGVSCS